MSRAAIRLAWAESPAAVVAISFGVAGVAVALAMAAAGEPRALGGIGCALWAIESGRRHLAEMRLIDMRLRARLAEMTAAELRTELARRARAPGGPYRA